MDRARWRNRIALPILVVTALTSTALVPPSLFAGLRPDTAAAAADCHAQSPAAAARRARGPRNARGAAARARAQLGKGGELMGKTLTVPIADGPELSINLPPESWVGQGVGNLVLYTLDSPGRGSEVRAVDVESGCDVRLAAPSEVVRSAVLDPAATALYVHSVARSNRSDAGVSRYDLASGSATQVVPGVEPSEAFGPIFGTALHWSVAGDSLAVQSCGFSECLTRVLDLVSGAIVTYAAKGQGGLIALTRTHLVTYGSCPGLPCAVLSADLAGDVTLLADEAFDVTVIATADGAARLSIQTAAGTVEIDQ